MPWKRKSGIFRLRRPLLIALAAAVAGGILSGLIGTLLHERGSALVDKYSSYRSLIGGHSESEIKAALRKRGLSGR